MKSLATVKELLEGYAANQWDFDGIDRRIGICSRYGSDIYYDCVERLHKALLCQARWAQASLMGEDLRT